MNLTAVGIDIHREHLLAQECAGKAVGHARRAGELLLEAKKGIAHGGWLTWLESNVAGMSERTAQGYMRLARECLADPAKAQRVADLSLRAALTDGVERREQAKAEIDLDAGPEHVPLRHGEVTIGESGTAAIIVFESRKHPGYWHDIDLRHGSASTRPVKPYGLRYRLADTASFSWRTETDDGGLLSMVGEAA